MLLLLLLWEKFRVVLGRLRRPSVVAMWLSGIGGEPSGDDGAEACDFWVAIGDVLRVLILLLLADSAFGLMPAGSRTSGAGPMAGSSPFVSLDRAD